VLINQPDARATGAGETAVTVAAGALPNAVFDATAACVRQVPFTPERIKAALDARSSGDHRSPAEAPRRRQGRKRLRDRLVRSNGPIVLSRERLALQIRNTNQSRFRAFVAIYERRVWFAGSLAVAASRASPANTHFKSYIKCLDASRNRSVDSLLS
jgi:hypothetical protein